MDAHAKIAVAGATGRVGRHVVDVLEERGHDVVADRRARAASTSITGEGLAEALAGVDAIVDAATGPSPEQEAGHPRSSRPRPATCRRPARAPACGRIVVVSIIGADRFSGGYGAAKIAHEQAHAGRARSRPAILRASQFHEFVDAARRLGPPGRRQPTCRRCARSSSPPARSPRRSPTSSPPRTPSSRRNRRVMPEIAGPRAENLVEVARLLVARRGDALRIEVGSNPADPDSDVYTSGALLPGPDATLAGPTFAEWLDSRRARGIQRADRDGRAGGGRAYSSVRPSALAVQLDCSSSATGT